MQYARYVRDSGNIRQRIADGLSARLGETADPDKPVRTKFPDKVGESTVARGEQRLALVFRQLIRSQVSTPVVQKQERAVIQNQMIGKKGGRRSESLGHETP